MNIETKEILNDYGYELWSQQEETKDYKVSKAKVAKSHAAIMEKRKNDLIKDVAAYELLTMNLPKKPPGR